MKTILLILILLALPLTAQETANNNPITVTWTQQGGQTYTWLIPTEAVAIFNKFIADTAETKTDPDDPTKTIRVTRYSGAGDLVVKHMIDTLIKPLLSRYPPPNIAQMEAEAKAAQKAVDAAKKVAAESVMVAQ